MGTVHNPRDKRRRGFETPNRITEEGWALILGFMEPVAVDCPWFRLGRACQGELNVSFGVPSLWTAARQATNLGVVRTGTSQRFREFLMVFG